MTKPSLETVAVSSRIRLARNFADYPFPAKLLTDPHGEEQAREIVRLISNEVRKLESFVLYDVGKLTDERAAFLVERYLVSRDLIRHRRISAALVSQDESISLMINEEDHIRAQYFMDGFDLKKAYERLSGIDDAVSDSIPFAFDETLGYLTACPTNLGTGLRASVMLFLPASARRGLMREMSSVLTRMGLTVRGVFGEGSGAEGDLFQISNEVTLGLSEADILDVVERAVSVVAETELRERDRMKAEEGAALEDRILRAYGILTNCKLLGAREYMERASDLKLGIALGLFDGVDDEEKEQRIRKIDELTVRIRPANIGRLHGAFPSEEEENAFRARYVADCIRNLCLIR